ncbi:hypothetical protein PoB_006337300 [Plakobranchus ocellatus]|uniref:Uncharacterized protein n=1 Tax=Plakobranchus ocellatus TaxID=259542 RepID=A0AAV4CY95_9GAST|nr:hypothetical protein PoB_006337300 [Plakobranchus ocellatus]
MFTTIKLASRNKLVHSFPLKIPLSSNYQTCITTTASRLQYLIEPTYSRSTPQASAYNLSANLHFQSGAHGYEHCCTPSPTVLRGKTFLTRITSRSYFLISKTFRHNQPDNNAIIINATVQLRYRAQGRKGFPGGASTLLNRLKALNNGIRRFMRKIMIKTHKVIQRHCHDGIGIIGL